MIQWGKCNDKKAYYDYVLIDAIFSVELKQIHLPLCFLLIVPKTDQIITLITWNYQQEK